MATDNGNSSLDDLENDYETIENWREKLWLKLRSELLNVITNDAITNAIERYKENIISYMGLTGEIENPRVEILNDESIPFPNGARYGEIIEDIWKHEMRHPTWSVEYREGSSTIRKDPRSTLDIYDLTLNEHAIIFQYAKSGGHFLNYSSDRKRMIEYISRHSLDVKLNTFKTLVSKYEWWEDRCAKMPLWNIYPFLEHWYFNGLAFLQSERVRCETRTVKQQNENTE